MEPKAGYSLYFAWLVSLVATAGSLYFSEVAGFVPCELCWIQRIFMYPLVIILGIACFRRDKRIVTYALPFPIIGGCFSIYHYMVQKMNTLPSMCQSGVPCSGEYINWFGFMTIPLLALIAFVFITVFLWLEFK